LTGIELENSYSPKIQSKTNEVRREIELKYIIKMSKMNGYEEDTILRLNEKHEQRRKFKEL
jgi:hypothetical protein